MVIGLERDNKVGESILHCKTWKIPPFEHTVSLYVATRMEFLGRSKNALGGNFRHKSWVSHSNESSSSSRSSTLNEEF